MNIRADRDQETICALATAPGIGAISVIRVSGPQAFEVIQKACPGLRKKSLESHKAYLTKIQNEKNEIIDQVVVTIFEFKKSYTGERSVEISSHGSPYIATKILDRLISCGARSAEKGEFTYRAFMNDRIDLVQAEAVLSVIESNTEQSLKVSLRQLEGETSHKFLQLESDLTWCLAHIEASIDFSTEGLETVSQPDLIKKLSDIQTELKKLIESYQAGRVLRNGLKVALVGRPNVGKSSLLNKLVRSEKAIVTNIAGTTRDVIEAETVFNGLKIVFSDTAGLRDATDQVEKIGVERSLNEATQADLCLFVFDASVPLAEADVKALSSIKNHKILYVGNKVDLLAQGSENLIVQQTTKKLQTLSSSNAALPVVFVSALDPMSRDQLLTNVTAQFKDASFLNESIISSARQNEMAEEAYRNVTETMRELQNEMGAEFISQTLKEALLAVQKILGHMYDDQIMDRVFKEFCLGK